MTNNIVRKLFDKNQGLQYSFDRYSFFKGKEKIPFQFCFRKDQKNLM